MINLIDFILYKNYFVLRRFGWDSCVSGTSGRKANGFRRLWLLEQLIATIHLLSRGTRRNLRLNASRNNWRDRRSHNREKITWVDWKISQLTTESGTRHVLLEKESASWWDRNSVRSEKDLLARCSEIDREKAGEYFKTCCWFFFKHAVEIFNNFFIDLRNFLYFGSTQWRKFYDKIVFGDYGKSRGG